MVGNQKGAVMRNKYQIFNPGEYFPWEKEDVELRLAMAEGRAEIPAKNRPAVPITEERILFYNQCYNPYDPLYNDPEYARSQGLPGVPAMPGFRGWLGSGIPGMPKHIGDEFYYTNDGADVRYERGIFAGDILSPRPRERVFRDLTKPGSDLRVWHIGSYGEMIDQDGKTVFKSYGNIRDCYKKIINSSTPPTWSEVQSKWWDYAPEAHYTTNEDWDYIRSLWKQEVIRGEEPLYWEDVEVGIEIPKTCSDGPITYMHSLVWDGGNPICLFDREELNDQTYLKTVFRDRYGQYLDEGSLHNGGRNIPNARCVWFNGTGANLIARTVTNFISNKGRVARFAWKFYPFFEELRTGSIAADMFDKVPFMKGRSCDRHGSEGDTCIGRACITNKFVNDNGEHEVEFAVWGETLDGDIVQACPMSAILPSRQSI